MNRRLLVLSPVLALLAACAGLSTQAPASVADTIARDPQLSTLNGLVQRAGLADTLKGPGPFTVFAPTNDAFAAVPAKTLQDLQADPARLKAVLAYHVVPGAVRSSAVQVGNARTVEGGEVLLGRAGDFVTVEDAMVQQPDLVAGNGVVHKVDRVLMPPKR